MRRLQARIDVYREYAAGIVTEVALAVVIFLGAFAVIGVLSRLVN